MNGSFLPVRPTLPPHRRLSQLLCSGASCGLFTAEITKFFAVFAGHAQDFDASDERTWAEKSPFPGEMCVFSKRAACMVASSETRGEGSRALQRSEELQMATKQKNAASAGSKKTTLSKSALVQAVAEAAGEDVSRKQVKSVIESLATVAHRELKKSGIFTLPGFAKFRVVKRPATKARQGVNPFTKQPMTFPAKPASKSVRARPIKAIKDALA